MGKFYSLMARQREIVASMANAEGEAFATLEREYNSNKREIEMMNQMQVAQNASAPVNHFAVNLREAIADTVKNGQKRDITLSVLSEGDTNNITSAGAIAKKVFDLLPLLEKGLIWDKVGLQIQTGVKGELLWPYATTNVEVDEADEEAELSDKDINFSNKTATPHRSGISILVTNEAIDDATFDLVNFVQTQMGLAVLRYLNKKTFSTANWTGLAGPFKNVTPSAIDCTYKNIKMKKAAIAKTGVDMSSFAYVCDATTKALLESTPKANGQGGMICENGMIDGDPVYVTEYINAKADGTYYSDKYYLAMGCWAYLAANQHGEVRLLVDPYSAKKKNATEITLNTRWSLTNLATATAFSIWNLTPVDETINVKVANTAAAPVNVAGPVTVANTAAAPVNIAGTVEVDSSAESPVYTQAVTPGV